MPEKEIKKKRSTFRKIVNVFLFIFIGIFFLIVLFIGFTQTATFRNILRDKTLAIVNKSLNGRVNFDKINGTIFTSLSLYNASVVLDKDTVIYAKKISVVYNPIQLLFSTIYVRDFTLEDAKVNLIKDSLGVYNISKLSKPKPEDTTKSTFPFKIDLNNFNIKNASIRIASYKNLQSDSLYNLYNMEDLRIDSLNLSLSTFLNIAKNQYHAKIKSFHFKPNLTSFRLNNLSGEFAITDNFARISNFHLKSNTTDIDLFASLENVNLFKNFKLSQLKNSPVKLSLNARIFDFTDLSSAISSTDFMKGTVKAKIDLAGVYGNLNINKLNIDYLHSHLEATGKLLDLQKPEDLYIKAHLQNSYINQSDIAELMPLMQIPVYKDLVVKNLTADFDGKTRNFLTTLSAELNEGSFKSKGNFDFTGKEMKYNVDLETSGLNLQPVLETTTLVNMNATISGMGTSLQSMDTKATVAFKNTRYDNYHVDSLKINTVVNGGIVNLNLNALSKGASVRIDSKLNLQNSETPVYNINGEITRLNLDKFIMDTTLATNLNLRFALNGKNFNLDKLESDAKLTLYNSTYQNIKIDTTELTLNFQNLPNNEKLIDFNSEFARLQVAGKFAPQEAIKLFGYESDIITRSVLKKIYEFNPLALAKDTVQAKEFEKKIVINTKVPDIVKTDVDIKYNLTIKDISLIASLAGMQNLDLSGRVYGGINNSNNLFSASTNIILNHVNMNTGGNQVYVSDLGLELKMNRINNPVAFENISAEAKLRTGRVFSGTDIKNIFVYFDIKKNLFSFNLSADVDTTINALIAGEIDVSKQQYDISVDNFMFNYLGYKWTNDSTWHANYSKDNLTIDHLSLVRESSTIDLTGSLFSDGKEKLNLKIDNLSAELISKFAGLKEDLFADIDASVNLNGYLHAPVIDINLDINSIIYNKRNLGFFKINLDYQDKLLKSKAVLLDSTANPNKPELVLTGNVPIDLAFVGAQKRLVNSAPLDISLLSDGFSLDALNGLVPFVNGLNGKLITDLKVGGTFDNIIYNGSLRLNDVVFVALQTNLPYKLGLKLSLAKDAVNIDSLLLANNGGTNYKGKMTGAGKITFKDMKLDNINANLSGDLALLSSQISPSIPYITGNLVVQSDGSWKYNYSNNGSNFDGKILLKNTAITITPVQSSYEGDNGYNYQYVSDSVNVDTLVKDGGEKEIRLSDKYNPLNRPTTKKSTGNSDFQYNVNLAINDKATLTFVIDPTTNATLVANLKGSMLYKSDGVAQGEFDLLDGSQLNWLKTLDATGKIYFESDPTNPRLDVTATYSKKYRDSIQVAVKIKLQGLVSELGKNLSKNSEDIGVYVGQNNIDQDVVDPEYGPLDAISFIVIGKFVNDLTQSDKAKAASNLSNSPGGGGLLSREQLTGVTESALSSLVSGFANSQLGNYVESIRINNEASTGSTNVSLSGTALEGGNLKYTFGLGIGGGADATSSATFNVEYQVIQNLLIRLERRDPVGQTNSNINDKILEMGLSYKFVF